MDFKNTYIYNAFLHSNFEHIFLLLILQSLSENLELVFSGVSEPRLASCMHHANLYLLGLIYLLVSNTYFHYT